MASRSSSSAAFLSYIAFCMYIPVFYWCLYFNVFLVACVRFIITVMTLGLKSHVQYGVPNEINDDDDDTMRCL